MLKKIRDLTLKEFFRRVKIGDLWIIGSVLFGLFSAGVFVGYKYYQLNDKTEIQSSTKNVNLQSGKNELNSVTNTIDSSSNSMNVVAQGDSNVYNINSK